jgi:hypothetical protein
MNYHLDYFDAQILRGVKAALACNHIEKRYIIMKLNFGGPSAKDPIFE